MQKIKTMLKLQQQLNDATNGKNWENGLTKNGKQIDWRRCIYLEAAELIESYPWKHWKNINASPDYENIKIEAVDIWHFVMSEALRIYKTEGKGDITVLAASIVSKDGYKEFLKELVSEHLDYYMEIEKTEKFMKSLFCNDDIGVLIERFFVVAIQSGLNLDALYSLYIGKNILNQFRQDHGYKDGSYIKVWNGYEDNVFMQELLKKNSEILPEELYEELIKAYPKA
jgi:hypothetical protein